ncbi:MAG: signal peptidase I [Clostridiales bacterium]|nr:signal peptidase I [Clostridiales bacterium]
MAEDNKALTGVLKNEQTREQDMPRSGPDNGQKEIKPAGRRVFLHLLRDVLSVVVSAVIIAFVLKTFVVDSRFVPTGSMTPTIYGGDRVVFLKLPYYFGKPPARLDIMVLASGERLISEDDLLKRVIGLPGDTVEIKNGLVYINGEALPEPYLNEQPLYYFEEVTVPQDCCFMLGDNRNHSTDSHLWDDPFVPFSDIKGKVLLRYWPLSHIGIIN